MKFSQRLLALCFVFVAAISVSAPVKVTEVEGVAEYRLDNGLKVLLVPDPGRPTITLNVTYFVGSRHENYGETGMAHLLEHLLFKGTPKHPNIPQELSRRGMSPNGATGNDYTSYYETFAASDEYLDWALGMEADRMVNSFVAEKDLRSEMTVVRNEMERGENSAANVLREKVLASAYQWHNYGRSVIGARSDVENVRIANLQAFYRLYYQPDNAMLVLAGKFEPKRALELVERHFGAIAKPARILPPLYTVEPPQEGARTVRLERLGENRILDVVYHLPSGSHSDFVALELFTLVMADTPSGRLHKSLVQTGKATAVGAWNADLFDPGYAFYSVHMRKNDSPQEVRRVLIDTLEGVARQPVTKEEVETARRAVQSAIEKTLNDPASLARALTNAAVLGDWRLFFWQRDQLARIDADEVNRVASRYFRAANRTLGEFAPVSEPTRVEIPATPDLARQLKGYAGKPGVAAGEAFDPSPLSIEARTQKATLANGMQLALLPKKTRGQTVRAVLTLEFGNAQNLFGQSQTAALTGAMLMRGTRQHDREALARELDRLRSQLQVSADGPLVTVTVESVRESLPATLRLVREILREPAFPGNEFEQLLKQTRAGIEAARIEPAGKAGEALAQHFNRYPKGDIRYHASFEEQLQALDAIRLENLRRFHAGFYGADHARFAAVGDFDAPAVRQLMAELFGDWKSPVAWQRLTLPFKRVAPVVRQLETPDKQNAVFHAALRIPVGEAHPDYPALLVASHIFGGGFISSRLANRLRQQEGLSYSVGADLNASREENSGVLAAYAIYAPQFRARVEQAFREELARVLRDGFTAQEVKDAQNALRQSGEMARSRDANLARMLASDLYYGQDQSRIAALEEKLARLAPGEIHAALKRHISQDAFSLFFAGDFAAKKAAGKTK
ncbi:zinc protease [Formivibrio citricus]|uniref:Zinc protease n=1 Tax=Formivibrio citricus TaxID=83765 RepID=A0A1I5CN98_9NEIS|nr:pitrilysin family protein [Formivibrio citricus]SFN88111.1 zinc protease [Formivibrio citricus]